MRQLYRWLAAGLVAFALYVSLLPFRLRPIPLAAAWSTFAGILVNSSSEDVSQTNVLANVLLFVPVGFALTGACLADRAAHLATIGLAAAGMLTVSLLASAAIEFLQVFAPGRIPSLTDIIAQGTGAAIGIAVWIAVGSPLTTWLRESAERHRRDRWTRALFIYAGLWLFAGLAPFDISFDIGRLAGRFRAGMIMLVPFGSSEPLGRQIWDAAATTITSIPLGMFALVVRQPLGTRRRASLACALGALGILALETAQIFTGFHAADVTDLLFGWIGVAIGVAAGTRVLGRAATLQSFSTGSRLGALVLTGTWALVVCGYHWQPFDFALDPALVRDKLDHISLVPFAGYQSGAELDAFTGMISKVAVAVPLGVGAAYVIQPATFSLAVYALWIAVATVFFGGVELGQLFIPSRSPDPTDVLVGVVSSLAGLHLGRWVRERRD